MAIEYTDTQAVEVFIVFTVMEDDTFCFQEINIFADCCQ